MGRPKIGALFGPKKSISAAEIFSLGTRLGLAQAKGISDLNLSVSEHAATHSAEETGFAVCAVK
jgi:hypothetical protein